MTGVEDVGHKTLPQTSTASCRRNGAVRRSWSNLTPIRRQCGKDAKKRACSGKIEVSTVNFEGACPHGDYTTAEVLFLGRDSTPGRFGAPPGVYLAIVSNHLPIMEIYGTQRSF